MLHLEKKKERELQWLINSNHLFWAHGPLVLLEPGFTLLHRARLCWVQLQAEAQIQVYFMSSHNRTPDWTSTT